MSISSLFISRSCNFGSFFVSGKKGSIITNKNRGIKASGKRVSSFNKGLFILQESTSSTSKIQDGTFVCAI